MSTAPDPVALEEAIRLQSLAGDEEYWDYLDRLEAQAGESREWDNPCFGGAS